MSHTGLPGAELIDAGLADLASRTETDASLLVSMAAPRLRSLGFDVPPPLAEDMYRPELRGVGRAQPERLTVVQP